ncbi:signal peptidase I [Macrococcus sp. DPC7161]|uniref:signal peptidase I n=1 Tax=Macrococcus sp. DPC7161 TaxID=2507060 RepID=UPI00100C0FAB|nr:signal peptidase I [Macrococcus sp. DPC7161]RXK18735.1 signal peptidase I [Macrococcus sp. DPC7161]
MKKKFLITVIMSFIIVVFIKSFFLTSYKVDGDSMSPTLQSGSYVFVNVLHDVFIQPKRNDIYFIKLNNNQTIVKRIVATPGDHVRVIHRQLYVNGEKTNYKDDTLKQLIQGNDAYGYTLPKQCFYVLGDHLKASTDSRTFGCVKLDEMLGKVVYTYWEDNK